MVTRKTIANQLLAYLNHRISLVELVSWAEQAIMDGDIETDYTKPIMQALGRIGLADVKEYGLVWEDCQSIMHSLGFTIRVDADLAA